MPRQNTFTSRGGFGIFLGALRDRRGEKQQALAVELGVARSTLAMVENGKRLPSSDLLVELERVFPESKQEIQDEAKRHRTTPLSPVDAEWLGIQREIDAQIASGEIQKAYETITPLLTDSRMRKRQRFWLHMRYWDIYTLSKVPAPLRITALPALYLAKDLRLSRSQRVPLCDRGANAALVDGEPELANLFLNEGLADFPSAAQLWYRKAVLEWTLGDLAAAYSALSCALRHKPVSRSDIMSLRGRILTEWRHYREAYKDLTAAFADPDNPPVERVATLGALLLNKCIRGEMSRSTVLGEFDQLEQDSPENLWVTYYRARCTLYLGTEEGGFRELEERSLLYDNALLHQANVALKQDPHDQKFQIVLQWVMKNMQSFCNG